jgi:hypothetical protein
MARRSPVVPVRDLRLVVGGAAVFPGGVGLSPPEPPVRRRPPPAADRPDRISRAPAGKLRPRSHALLEQQGGAADGTGRHARLRSRAPRLPVPRLHRRHAGPAGAGHDRLQPVHRRVVDLRGREDGDPDRGRVSRPLQPVGRLAGQALWPRGGRTARGGGGNRAAQGRGKPGPHRTRRNRGAGGAQGRRAGREGASGAAVLRRAGRRPAAAAPAGRAVAQSCRPAGRRDPRIHLAPDREETRRLQRRGQGADRRTPDRW